MTVKTKCKQVIWNEIARGYYTGEFDAFHHAEFTPDVSKARQFTLRQAGRWVARHFPTISQDNIKVGPVHFTTKNVCGGDSNATD